MTAPSDPRTATLVQFLRAQLDEDAEAAEAVIRWRGRTSWFVEAADDGPQESHILRHGPARVLAEVAAKRRIVERYEETARPYADSRQQEIHETLRDEVLPFLAQAYADRPDYEPAWRP